MSDRFNELPPTEIDQIMLANSRWPAFVARHPGAINTTVGVMIDPVFNHPWQPKSVQEARRDALNDVLNGGAFGYQTQTGYAPFLAEAGKMIFGRETYVQQADKLLAFQTAGGTGALSLAKDILSGLMKRDGFDALPYIPLTLDPGWPNHPAIFTDPFAIATYKHTEKDFGNYDHLAALDAFFKSPKGSVFVLQTCGYNDDGMDRSYEQWDDVLDVAEDKQAIVILDSAYMGLVNGFQDDRYPIKESVRRGLLTLVSYSASKNMGLYNERVGALFIANAEQNLGEGQLSRLNQLASRIVRRTVSNPPLAAAKAAAVALSQDRYAMELESARAALNRNRDIFSNVLKDELPALAYGRGLFVKLHPDGFSERQQEYLADAGVFALPNSRINIGGMHSDKLELVGNVILRALRTIR